MSSSSDETPQPTVSQQKKVGRNPKRGPPTVRQAYKRISDLQKDKTPVIPNAALRRAVLKILRDITAKEHGKLADIQNFRLTADFTYMLRSFIEEQLIRLLHDTRQLSSQFNSDRKTLTGRDIAARISVSKNVILPQEKVSM